MSYVLGALLVLGLIWWWRSMNYSHRKRLHLGYYAVYLLLDDEIRSRHAADFRRSIQQATATDADRLALGASKLIEDMADRLASPSDASQSSLFGSRAMLWAVHQATTPPKAS
jgi:hypothetical protein